MGNNKHGMTDKIWNSESQEFRFKWSLLYATVAITIGLVIVTKTGFKWIDAPVGFLTALITVAVIQSQRSLSKFDAAYRRKVTRQIVICTRNAIGLLALSLFLAAVVPIARVEVSDWFLSFPSAYLPPTERAFLLVVHFLKAIAVISATIYAPLHAIHGTGTMHAIRVELKNGLIYAFVRRRYKAVHIVEFVFIELLVLVCSIGYGVTVVAATRIALTPVIV